ncbi:Rapamycin-insensitive companion of mTOR, N-term-domain-containing protein [Cristinia sonorae]|uniref:Rapamycin-insensitive companion of mTOR, N-term-domain-containing protein n=1 Tax=Cristinia sonorae TaxID=1940300 RepID=A0A8K0XSU8_9AGAR|nr:Rapamycin-insensitive companion of mTOR, N-term-domain-containing protein [Cristinia sonorae]
MSSVLVDQHPGLTRSNSLRSSEAHTSTSFTQSSTTTAVNGSSFADSISSENGGNGRMAEMSTQLREQNNIKVGAEKLLQMPIPTDLRPLVMDELEQARSKIDDIEKQIADETSRVPRNRAESGAGRRKPLRGDAQVHVSARNGRIHNEDRDDFRSALQQASTHLKALNSLNRNGSPSTTLPVSSSSTSALTDAELSRARVEAMTQLTGVLQRNLRVRYEVSLADVVQAALPSLAERSTKQCRATAYRLIRHLLVDTRSVEKLCEQAIDWYIVKSIARDNKHAVEREQAIKLIRAMIEIGSQRRTPHAGVGTGTVPLSKQIMRAIVAVAEHPEDPFRPICVQTLSEILLIDIELLAKTGGIRVLLHALAEGPLEMAPIISSAFLYIVDSPRTRAYLHPGIDLEMVLSGITDAYGKNTDHSDRMRGLTKILVSMLRTWSGLMYFCLNDKLAMRSLIDGLKIPSLTNRDIILDMFFDLLNIKPPDWHEAFIAGRRLTMIRRSRQLTEPAKAPETLTRTHEALKLTDQYVALLILVLNKAGLIDALTSMLQEATIGSNLSRKATLLMAEILQTSNRVLPLSIASKLQAIPQVFRLAADYDLGENRIVGTTALSAIDSYNRHRTRLQPAAVRDSNRPRANSVEEAVRRGQRQAEQTKIKLGMQMDDRTFQAALLETQVQANKDHTKWNIENLQDLFEGALLNPKRMEEAIKVSRIVKKLMQFYHPFSHRFSDLPKSKANHRWVKLGCTMLNCLMSSPDGLRFLAEDEFLDQLTKSFAQLDPFNGTPMNDSIFSKQRMQSTETSGYFEMLGTMSKRKEGQELLEKFKLFTAFYHLSELRSREDLTKGIIDNLDYSIDGHSRIVLSKALTSSYKHVRMHATNHLGELIRTSPTANSWTLRLLLTQLYDPAIEVQEVAVRYLEEACEAADILQAVVEMHPTLDHLGEVGHPLLLKFMSTTLGFRYLYAADYIDREMDLWFHERNLHYVVYIEVFLSKAFNFTPSDDADDLVSFDGIVPPHFYGVMAKTDLGCQVLQEKGHFGEFVAFIRKHGLESEDQDIILKLKSVLWTVGNIGASERGLPFLEEEEIIPTIVDIAEQSLVLSIRGTCFFVLGLISSTPQGAEILDDYHWEATLDPLGFPTGLCVPLDVDKLVSIPSWDTTPVGDDGLDRLEPPKTEEEMEVITAIYNLSNTVIANTASRSLARMKARPEYKHIFSSTSMLYRALHAISNQRYRLPVRRYICELFNVELNADTVKALLEHEKALKVAPETVENGTSAPPSRAVSIAWPSRHRRPSDSDEESVSDDDMMPSVAATAPGVKMRPQSRIVGFAETDN